MASRVALRTCSRYLGLLNPLTNGGSGPMSIVPIAQVSPACLSTGKNLGAISSMLSQPSCRGDLGRLVHVPVLLEAPVDDRLLDPAVLDGPLGGWRLLALAGSQPRRSAASRPRPAVCLSISRRLLRSAGRLRACVVDSSRVPSGSEIGTCCRLATTDPITIRQRDRPISRLIPTREPDRPGFVSDLATSVQWSVVRARTDHSKLRRTLTADGERESRRSRRRAEPDEAE